MNPNFKNTQVVLDGYDYTVDEGNNTFIALRKVKWSENGTPRLDLRKYVIDANGEEVMQKGVGLITEEGPHELTRVLVETGYGHTGDLIVAMRTRDDFVKEVVDKFLQATDIEKDASSEELNCLEDMVSDTDSDSEELFDLEEEGIL